VVKKLWPPIVTPDYTPYIAQFTGVDAVVQGFAGSNPVKFMKQYSDAGVTLPVLGGATAGDDALMKSFGDDVIGMVTAAAYTADLDSPSNKHFVEGMMRDYGSMPGPYASGLYISGMVAEAALDALGGKTDDKEALIKALRTVSLVDSPRGPFHFDHFGNVVGGRCPRAPAMAAPALDLAFERCPSPPPPPACGSTLPTAPGNTLPPASARGSSGKPSEPTAWCAPSA
jgi:branched-chain amino acid transport system substrate-binding protein